MQVRASRFHATGAATVAFAFAISGCGSESDYKNSPRPPAPIVVTASISKDRVSVSPMKFGAGPINLVIVNQTDRSQQITLETQDEQKTGIRQETGPINPRDTASLNADVREGAYRVSVSGNGIRPAMLAVGAPRPTSQNDLLLP
jgi:hypothetical protein